MTAWAALELLAIRILGGGSPRLWLGFGVVAGLGLLDKYSVALFAAGLIVGMLCTAQRRRLLSPWPFLGGAIALLLFLPHLWWEDAHGWPTREFMANATARKNVALGPLDFFAGQLTLSHPVAAPLWIAGLVALLTTRGFAALR